MDSDLKRKYHCPNEKDGCTKKFKEEGMNDQNFNRHVNNCHYGKRKKKGIGSYFSKGQKGNCSADSTAGSSTINNTGQHKLQGRQGEDCFSVI